MATRQSSTNRRGAVRASQRQVHAVTVNAASKSLRALMTEQCRRDDGFATFYRGTLRQFEESGFDAGLVACGSGERWFRLRPGGLVSQIDQEVDACFRRRGGEFELEVHWSPHGPMGAAHPVLDAIASRIAIAISYWTLQGSILDPSDLAPTAKLVESASDDGPYGSYPLSQDRRFRYTPATKSWLVGLAHSVASEIRRGEIFEDHASPEAANKVASVHQAALVIERVRRA